MYIECWHTNHHRALPSRSLIAIQLWQLHQLFKNNEVFQLTFNAIWNWMMANNVTFDPVAQLQAELSGWVLPV